MAKLFTNLGLVFLFSLGSTAFASDSLYNLKVIQVIRFPANYYGNTLVLAKTAEGAINAIYFNGVCGGTAENAITKPKELFFNAYDLTPTSSYNGYPTYLTPNGQDNCNLHL